MGKKHYLYDIVLSENLTISSTTKILTTRGPNIFAACVVDVASSQHPILAVETHQGPKFIRGREYLKVAPKHDGNGVLFYVYRMLPPAQSSSKHSDGPHLSPNGIDFHQRNHD